MTIRRVEFADVREYIFSKGMHSFEPILFFTNGISGLIVILSLLLYNSNGFVSYLMNANTTDIVCVNIINNTESVLCFTEYNIFSSNNLSLTVISLIINVTSLLILVVWIIIRIFRMMNAIRENIQGEDDV